MNCRCCHGEANQIFVDLGNQPPSNAYLTAEQLGRPEKTFPLTVYVCNECWLVQLPNHANSDELFTETYAYFSSISSTWVEHARRYVADVAERFELGAESFVVEVASNDGYLLQFFDARGVRCLGVEPTTSTANAARKKGIHTVEEFFGLNFAKQLVREHGTADLLVGNNVLAHVPDLNDFMAGVAVALSHDGIATFEFPHLMQLVRGRQFDTIYHEHYSYLSLYTVIRLFESHGLEVFDVEELPTHGGSLRVYATLMCNRPSEITNRVGALLERESVVGMRSAQYYANFQPHVETIKNDLLAFLVETKKKNKVVCGYGAAAKGNTLLNYAEISVDLLPFVCDAAPSKQGRFLPGSHIPIVAPAQLQSSAPDHVLILPWNIATEVIEQQSELLPMKTQFHVAVPAMRNVRRNSIRSVAPETMKQPTPEPISSSQ